MSSRFIQCSLRLLWAAGAIVMTACARDLSSVHTHEKLSSPSPPASADSLSRQRLDLIRERQRLICGIDGDIPGFSFADQPGEYSGLDVDICRAIATALFNNPDAVDFRTLDAIDRFTALKSGEVDILARNTTWTLARDVEEGLTFAPIVFYDFQDIMVRQGSPFRTLADFDQRAICIQKGTTAEINLANELKALDDIQVEQVVFYSANAAYAGYSEGRCDGITSDRSQLLGRRRLLPHPEQHRLLDLSLSKEPLSPVTVDGDMTWAEAVRWIIFGLMQAEEWGLNSQTVETAFQTTTDPDIRRFLGKEGNLGSTLGLPNTFMYNVIRQVGNYQEIYDRNLGQNSEIHLPREKNHLWTQSGLLYAPPFQ